VAEQTLEISKHQQMHTNEYEKLVNTEWLLTNKRGSFACGSLCGTNTRRYHGLLVGAAKPVINRMVALSNCLETIITERDKYNLQYFEFDPPSNEKPRVMPKGFTKDAGVHFSYSTRQFELVKSIYLSGDSDIVAIEYHFMLVREKFEFNVRPFAALRS